MLKAVAITPLKMANIRKYPTMQSNIVGYLNKYDVVVLEKLVQPEQWTHILAPRDGWVFPGVKFEYIVENDEEFVETPEEVRSYATFCSPVATSDEQNKKIAWGAGWYDASPFAKLYFVGQPNEAYHTGADLNLAYNADANRICYACSDGVVLYAKAYAVWGNLIVIKHNETKDGIVARSRYAHLNQMLVKAGDRVIKGQPVGKIGNAFGRFSDHLHFDISRTNILDTYPQHWPGKDLNSLIKNYLDPLNYIKSNLN